ncbi:MAG: sterol desaturase family protein, partial [Bdellovibrionales bacterium]|nr:sterol desaturase family protein [Bdellovibrionales bacterium]
DDKPVWLQAVGAFLIVDFTLFITHYLQHKLRWVWYFHTIHHSQEHISALTALRIHWIEYLFDAIIVTVPIAFVGGDISTWFLLALFNNSWGYVVHANARIPLGPLEYLIVTPQYHRLHHSKNPQHFDKNFCERLTLWDFIFGTMCMDFDSVRETGVDGFPVETPERSLSALLNRWKTQTIYPFRLLMQDLHKAISQRT